jgi:hypothetical protein
LSGTRGVPAHQRNRIGEQILTVGEIAATNDTSEPLVVLEVELDASFDHVENLLS